jgi:O-antigen/teichoic acid export membrane protein
MKKMNHGTTWTIFSSIFLACITFLQLAVMARLSTSEAFGQLAIIVVVISLSQVFADAGIGNYVTFKDNLSKSDRSTVYFLGLMLGSTTFFLVALVACFVLPSNYSNPIYIPLCIAAFSLVTTSAGQQFQAAAFKNFRHKDVAKIDVVAKSVGVITTIALYEFGVYAFVFGNLSQSILKTAFLIGRFYQLNTLCLAFNRKAVMAAQGYGLYTIGSQILSQLNFHGDKLILSLVVSTETLGVFYVLKSLIVSPAQIINNIFVKLYLPRYASAKMDDAKLSMLHIKSLGLYTSCLAPLYMFFVFYPQHVLLLAVGENYSHLTVVFSALSMAWLIRSISGGLSSPLSQGTGQVKNAFYWSLVTIPLVFAVLVFTANEELIQLAIALVIIQLILTVPATYYLSAKISTASTFSLVKTYVKNLLPSVLVMYMAGFFVGDGVLTIASLFLIALAVVIASSISLVLRRREIYELYESKSK